MCRNLDLQFLLFYCLLLKFFPVSFRFFLLSVLLSFLLLSNWFLFLSSFIFPLLFRHCFIPVSLAHVVSSLAYPNLLGTKRLGCCCCCCTQPAFKWNKIDGKFRSAPWLKLKDIKWHLKNRLRQEDGTTTQSFHEGWTNLFAFLRSFIYSICFCVDL
jgi:hypothetical protein